MGGDPCYGSCLCSLPSLFSVPGRFVFVVNRCMVFVDASMAACGLLYLWQLVAFVFVAACGLLYCCTVVVSSPGRA